MKTLPSIIIVTDRGHLIAYHSTEEGSLRKLESHAYEEGNTKLSDVVTDQAGSFQTSGTPGSGTHESMPMLAEREVRCFRRIADTIAQILKREQAKRWALSAPIEINGAIFDHLEEEHRQTLVANLKLDLIHSTPEEIRQRFEQYETIPTVS